MPGARRPGRLDEADAFQMPGDARQPVDEPPEPEGPSAVELAQIEVLERELVDVQRHVAELEQQMTELESARTADLGRLSPEAFASALQSTLAAYRAGTVLDGKVPLVLDGVLDRIRPDACDAAVDILLRADDLQAIVVSNEPAVVQRIGSAGGTMVRWPEPDHQPHDAAHLTG